MRIHLVVAVAVVTVAAAIATAATYATVDSSHNHGRAGYFGQLSEEQRTAVQDAVKQMKQKGASREEIHASVRKMLEGFGMKVPEGSGKHRGGAGFLSQLSKEQRTAVRDMVKQMKQKGASREEIRASVRRMLQGFGIAAPAALHSGAPALLGGTSSAPSASWGAIKSMFR